MKLPKPRQIARAWNGVEQEYSVRRNKTHDDGKQFEVYCLFPGPISEKTLKVLARYADHESAERHADSLDDDARAKAVLSLFRS